MAVLAYKCLRDGRSLYTGYRWPVPSDGRPGPWVEAGGTPVPCANGFHGATIEQLPFWLSTELWVVELEGRVIEAPEAVIGTRARLHHRVAGWAVPAWQAFGRDCAVRATSLATGSRRATELVRDLEESAEEGDPVLAGYIGAMLAGEAAAGSAGSAGGDGGTRSGPVFDAGFAAERAHQADWLAAHVRL